jgi:hypothetical protein
MNCRPEIQAWLNDAGIHYCYKEWPCKRVSLRLDDIGPPSDVVQVVLRAYMVYIPCVLYAIPPQDTKLADVVKLVLESQAQAWDALTDEVPSDAHQAP